MRTPLCIFGLLCLALSFLLHSSSLAQPSGGNQEALKALAAIVKDLDSAYNVRDVEKFCALFAEDAEFQFVVEGEAFHGRDQIRQHFAKQFAIGRPLRHVTTTRGTDPIAPGVLAVDLQVEIFVIDPQASGAQTLLAHYDGMGIGVRGDAGWHIRLVRLYRAAKK
jgi:uncharacterized protein (TIGR02246 family)